MAQPAVPYAVPVGARSADVRVAFLRRVYGHLGVAVALFALFESFLFTTGLAYAIAEFVFGTSWLLILGGFVLVSWLSSSVAHRARTPAAQYGAYAALIVAEGLLFAPMLAIVALPGPPFLLFPLLWFGALFAFSRRYQGRQGRGRGWHGCASRDRGTIV